MSEAYVRRFRVSFPGKVIIADIRINRPIFKAIDVDLDKIFRKENFHKSTSRKYLSNYDGEDVDKFQDQIKIQAEAVDRNNNNKIVERVIVMNNRSTEDGLQDNAQIETVKVPEVNSVIKTSTKEVAGVKSDSELLVQDWVKDLLIGNFPKGKDLTKASPKHFNVHEVDGQDNDRSLLSAIVRFGKEIKIKFSGKAQVPKKYDVGDVEV